MGKRLPDLKRLLLPAAGVLVICVCRLALAGAEQPGPKSPPAPQTVAVEAIGLATMKGGETVEQAHREALLDARRNALVQAHIVLDAQTRLRNMRIEERLVRSQATGYVEQMHVREAGIVPDSDPPVYRVKVMAMVRPLEGFSLHPAHSGPDQWQPVVELALTSDLPPEAERDFSASLEKALRRCGIVVVPAGPLRAGLVLEVRLLRAVGARDQTDRVDWEMGYGEAPGAKAAKTPGPVSGRWHTSEAIVASSESWERLAALWGQDAVRLWARPRSTTVVFLDAREADIVALSRAFGPAASVHVRKETDSPKLVAELPLAGDPVQALQPVLREAGLAGRGEPVLADMTYLVLRLSPAGGSASTDPLIQAPAEAAPDPAE
ncbi:MAG: hypothetical protein QGH74_02710 [Candidatus Brocadiia bacterium]|jgi:hypothetical protein|nr:hypothetical protein [Candidatus Brocadiia bacterium]